MSNSNSPGSIVREGYFESISTTAQPPRLQDDEAKANSGKFEKLPTSRLPPKLQSIYFSGKSDMMFFIFVTFICCCGLALILLTIFLWRKYTRAGGALAANCDTFIQQEQQQHLVSVCAFFVGFKIMWKNLLMQDENLKELLRNISFDVNIWSNCSTRHYTLQFTFSVSNAVILCLAFKSNGNKVDFVFLLPIQL